MLKKIMPQFLIFKLKRVKISILLLLNSFYDFRKFLVWSGISSMTQTQFRAIITVDYHRLEKGLSLKSPRVGFGRDVVARLSQNVIKYQEKYGIDETFQIAVNVLDTYYSFNKTRGLIDEKLGYFIQDLKAMKDKGHCDTHSGGILKIRKEDLLAKVKLDLRDFFNCRYSIRNFSQEDVSLKLIEDAVLMAQKTPSVCNRQATKVYSFSKSQLFQKLLTYQNGNRGFGEDINKILLITSDVEHFLSVGERNQCWIDGGMFAMSLVYALHSLGVGTCCLNLSIEKEMEEKIKTAGGIKDSERLIMFIGVGHLSEEFNVAASPRKKIEEIFFRK